MKLPEYNQTRRTGDYGVKVVKSIIENNHKWLFRKTDQDDDFGLDGYIDLLEEGKYITGKTIGIQIKTGESYFKNPTSFGWTYYGEEKHLNYYLNLDIPVIIALVDPIDKKVFWNKVDIDSIIKTGNGWKIVIPKSQELSDKTELKKTTNDYIDYTDQIIKLSRINRAIIDSEKVFIAVDRYEIETSNFDGFDKLLKWLTSSEEMIKKNRGKFFISVFGYDDDERELYEFEEVRKWMKEVMQRFKYWGYFLYMDKPLKNHSSLWLLSSCCVDVLAATKDEKGNRWLIEPDAEQAAEFRNYIFHWLNEFSEKYAISDQINFEQSMKISQILDGLTDQEIQKIKTEYGYK